MANWLHGYLLISGTLEDVNAVLRQLFHRNRDSFFAGVFPESTEEETHKLISHCENGTFEVSLPAKYHTSIYSCFLTDTRWDNDGNFFGMLSEECRCHHVKIAAEGTEYLGAFNEMMKCNAEGEIIYEFRKIDIAECSICGEQKVVPKETNIRALICPRCGRGAIRSWRDI